MAQQKIKRKLYWVANIFVLGVNELQDGSAASAIDDISREFEKFATSMLGLPNLNSINWTLVVSSTSGSAATQKHMNRLVEDCRQSDEERLDQQLLRRLMSLKHSVPCIWV